MAKTNTGSWPFSSFFCCWSHIESSSFLFRVIRWEIFLRLREIGQAGGYPRLTSLSIKNPSPEEKPQYEYVLDSRIHSRPDPPWNFLNLQKHSRRGLVMIFSKITRCWSGRIVGFCERNALIMLLLKRKKMPLFDVDSSTLPFLVEEG